jgi:hypothetical protein
MSCWILAKTHCRQDVGYYYIAAEVESNNSLTIPAGLQAPHGAPAGLLILEKLHGVFSNGTD